MINWQSNLHIYMSCTIKLQYSLEFCGHNSQYFAHKWIYILMYFLLLSGEESTESSNQSATFPATPPACPAPTVLITSPPGDIFILLLWRNSFGHVIMTFQECLGIAFNVIFMCIRKKHLLIFFFLYLRFFLFVVLIIYF